MSSPHPPQFDAAKARRARVQRILFMAMVLTLALLPAGMLAG